MADPMLAWNDPNVGKSSLQIYLANGGDPSRAGEFLYASGAQGNTAQERTKDFMRPRTPQELQAKQESEAVWRSHFLGSQAYNPNGANSYAIQNSTNNSYTQNPITGNFEGNGSLPVLATLNNQTRPVDNTPIVNNSATGSDIRSTARRSDSAAYSNGPQYTQSASLGNQNPYLSGMYQAQNLNNNNLGLNLNNGSTSGSPSRSINFSKALWR